jgi:KAP family P-loop domain
VVYIDDLDRCPPDRVVQVLEAVQLLLAVRLFVVVVAVDPRWLLRSLTVHYQELFEAASPATTSQEGSWGSTPMQYLEKIFQIPFTLPPVDHTGYITMVDALTAPDPSPGRSARGPDDGRPGSLPPWLRRQPPPPRPPPGPHGPGRSRYPPYRWWSTSTRSPLPMMSGSSSPCSGPRSSPPPGQSSGW